MSSQEFTLIQENSNVVWMPNISNGDSTSSQTGSLSQPYYRSQAFQAQVATNALVAAAYPLLTLSMRLQQAQKYSDLTALYQLLTHEIRAFESQAKKQGYRENTINIASYLLCVLLDQTILQAKWGKSWQSCLLLNAFHEEEISSDRVYQVIERLLKHPNQYLHLLELSYFCLSFGLNNPHQQNIPPELLERLDSIYRHIREERGEISQGFLTRSNHHGSISIEKPSGLKSFSLVSWVYIAVAVMSVAYVVFACALKSISMPLMLQLSIFNVN